MAWVKQDRTCLLVVSCHPFKLPLRVYPHCVNLRVGQLAETAPWRARRPKWLPLAGFVMNPR
jgi:hypothetical protein